jgi:outer membrane lipoprotein-sorting protein
MRRIVRALAAISLVVLLPIAPLEGGVAAAQGVEATVAPAAVEQEEGAVSHDALRTWTELSEVRTLQASFVQIRTSRILTRPLESRGTLRFSQPDRMAWAVEHPASSTFVMEGTRVAMAYPDLGVREELDLGGNADVAALIQATMVWLGGDLERVRRDYTVEWKGGTPAIVVLRPKVSALSAIIATLELTIEREPTIIREVRITEPDGDTVEIRFADVKLGEALPADAFSLP